MVFCTIIYSTVPSYTVLHYAVLHNAVLSCTAPDYIEPYHVMHIVCVHCNIRQCVYVRKGSLWQWTLAYAGSWVRGTEGSCWKTGRRVVGVGRGWKGERGPTVTAGGSQQWLSVWLRRREGGSREVSRRVQMYVGRSCYQCVKIQYSVGGRWQKCMF